MMAGAVLNAQQSVRSGPGSIVLARPDLPLVFTAASHALAHSSIQIESVREFSKATAGGFDAGAMGAMQGAMHSEFMMGKPQQVCMRHACPLLFGRD